MKGSMQCKEGKEINYINESCLKMLDDLILLTSPMPLKTLSSSVTGAGFLQDQRYLANRYVGKDYNCHNHREEMKQYLLRHNIHPLETVGMMTAVKLDKVVYKLFAADGFSVFIVVTAGVSNAIDVTLGHQHSDKMNIGTINTWVIINGIVMDEAFVQSIVTAVEAKTKALQELGIKDHITGTAATGTSTDSIVIAATQSGNKLGYAGPITKLGREIGLGVYYCTKEAIEKNMGKRPI